MGSMFTRGEGPWLDYGRTFGAKKDQRIAGRSLGNNLSHQLFHLHDLSFAAPAENAAKVAVAVDDETLRDTVEIADL